MATDALFGVSGPLGVPGNDVEASAITADGYGTKGWRAWPKGQSGYAEIRVAGAFDRTSGDETLAVQIRQADDAAGTNAETIATSTTLIASMAESGVDGTSTGPARIHFGPTTRSYVAVYYDVGGNTPSAAGVSVKLHPTADAYAMSGTI